MALHFHHARLRSSDRWYILATPQLSFQSLENVTFATNASFVCLLEEDPSPNRTQEGGLPVDIGRSQTGHGRPCSTCAVGRCGCMPLVDRTSGEPSVGCLDAERCDSFLFLICLFKTTANSMLLRNSLLHDRPFLDPSCNMSDLLLDTYRFLRRMRICFAMKSWSEN